MAELSPRQAVFRMAAYHPPTGGREGALRLDFNEHTVGCSPAVVAAIRKHARAPAMTMYPEYEAARRNLAAFFGVAQAEMLLTNGTDEAIQLVVNTFVDPSHEVLLLKPSYAMYRLYGELVGAVIREVEYRRPRLDFPLEELLAAITPATRAILIANPNNPTGASTSLDVMSTILERAPHAAVLVDEAYFEFCGITALPLLSAHTNLFVCRTFSKAYGMAALRAGCLFSTAGNVGYLRKVQSPYSVNTLAALAASAAVQDHGYVTDYVRLVLDARAQIVAGLAALGIESYPTQANFVLFQTGDRAIPIRDALRRRGILVRDRGYELPGCLRVTCGTPEQAARFLNDIKELW